MADETPPPPAPATSPDDVRRWWDAAPPSVKAAFSTPRPQMTTDGPVPVTNRTASPTPVTNAQDVSGFLPFAGRFRQGLLDLILDPRRQIDKECGYPADTQLTPEFYLLMYRRVGLANRVVSLMPAESWRLAPVIYEDEDEATQTPFEAAVEEVWKRCKANYRLHQIDRVSGIGRFGGLFLGLDDGKPLDQPAAGLGEDGVPTGDVKARLLYLRSFGEGAIKVQSREMDKNCPRFGLPKFYRITFDVTDTTGEASIGPTGLSEVVHWTRVIHVAETRDQSEVFGTPRLEPVINPTADVRKTLGGGAEMYWKGGFPGYALALAPGVGAAELDKEAIRHEIDDFQNGLSRVLGLVGIDVKSLSPAIASPREVYDVLIDYICLCLGVPKRVFMGSEQAQLASSQDAKRWNERIAKRCEEYLTPMLIREFVDRLIHLGCLPEPEDEYFVWWPDLNVTTDTERVDIAVKRTQCLAQYQQSGASDVMAPLEFLTEILDFEPDHARAILKAAAVHFKEHAEPPHDDELGSPGTGPPLGGVTPDPAKGPGAEDALRLEQDPTEKVAQ